MIFARFHGFSHSKSDLWGFRSTFFKIPENWATSMTSSADFQVFMVEDLFFSAQIQQFIVLNTYLVDYWLGRGA